MVPTRLRRRYGYCQGISAAVPIEVAKEIDRMVVRRAQSGRRRGASGRNPCASDVVRGILVAWLRAHRRAAGACTRGRSTV